MFSQSAKFAGRAPFLQGYLRFNIVASTRLVGITSQESVIQPVCAFRQHLSTSSVDGSDGKRKSRIYPRINEYGYNLVCRPTIRQPTPEKPYSWERLKSPMKRAGNLLRELNVEAMVQFEEKQQIPYFRPGDALEVTYAQSTKTPEVVTVRGLVLGRSNRHYGSSFKLLCNIDGTSVEYDFPLYTPLIRQIRVIQEAFLHRGKKRVRRAKLYYVRERPIALYTVKEGFAYEMDRRRRRAVDQAASESESTETNKE